MNYDKNEIVSQIQLNLSIKFVNDVLMSIKQRTYMVLHKDVLYAIRFLKVVLNSRKEEKNLFHKILLHANENKFIFKLNMQQT